MRIARLISISLLISILLHLIFPNKNYSAKYTAAFLNAGAGARALGMGGSYGALGYDATTIYWNPAGLGCVSEPELVLMHSAKFGDFLKYDTGHFVWPNTVSGSFGLGFIRLATGDIYFTQKLSYRDWGLDHIPGTGDTGEADGKYQPGEQVIYDPNNLKVVNDSENALFLSYARQLTAKLSLGGNIKLIRQLIGDYSSFGWGFDVGLLYDLNSHLTLGLNLQDIFGTVIRWNTGHSDVRAINVRPAIGYSKYFPNLKSRFNLATDVDIRFENIQTNSDVSLGITSFDFHGGAEYLFYDTIALRAGIDQKKLTVGAGIRLLFFGIDYAFAGYDLGNTHRISITLHRPSGFRLFGTKSRPKQKPRPKHETVTEEVSPEKSSEPLELKPRTSLEPKTEKPLLPKKEFEKQEQFTSPEAEAFVSKQIGTIEFETGKADLRPESQTALRFIAGELKKYPAHIIKIIGHTDNVPISTQEYPTNQVLSLTRAQTVKSWLVRSGEIQPERFITLGFGETRPITSNDTAEGRKRNRRVEIIIMDEKVMK